MQDRDKVLHLERHLEEGARLMAELTPYAGVFNIPNLTSQIKKWTDATTDFTADMTVAKFRNELKGQYEKTIANQRKEIKRLQDRLQNRACTVEITLDGATYSATFPRDDD